ncbi:gibberellin 20-oxidase [Seiridium cupressi]
MAFQISQSPPDPPSVRDIAAEGKPVVSATLPVLSLGRLRAGDAAENAKLLEACDTYGFFYLDLSPSPELLADWVAMLSFAENYFGQPIDDKMKDSCGSDTNGYEAVGTSAGATLTEVDAYESLKISEAEMRGGKVAVSSPLVHEHSELFFRFIRSARGIAMMLLERLSDKLGQTGLSRLENYHAEDKPSLSTLSMFRYPKHQPGASGVGHNKHTDLGTFTFLLARQWGLQVLSPDTDSWAFVAPRPNHALINVGDSLRFISGFRLASVVHRVLPVQETQHEDRYSIAYFLRMSNDVEYRDGSGELWSAQKWHDFKFETFRSPLGSDMSLQALTGGMEKDDRLVV